MAKTIADIVVGANGTVRVAPDGTTLPVDIDEAWHANFVDLGYTDEDGVNFEDGKDITDIKVWQLFYPARKIVTAKTFDVGFNLSQFGSDQVEFAFGGGTVVATANGHIYTPPPPESLDIRALGVDWVDGVYNFRLVVSRGIVSENVSTDVKSDDAALLPIGFSAVGDETLDPWYLLTDHPNWAPVGS